MVVVASVGDDGDDDAPSASLGLAPDACSPLRSIMRDVEGEERAR